MSNITFEDLRDQAIGTVEAVSAQRIEILLATDSPQSTAINAGVPTPFPRINSYVLIPNEAGAVVGMVTWLGTKQAQYPKRKGYKDFDLVDLPFPLRQMHLRPVGTLKKDNRSYIFNRGVYTFPSIADIVVLPTPNQLSSIIENNDKQAQVLIGHAPIAANAEIKVDPDKLFGRHCAVLGNTGSGKSCTVAGLIRWSLEEANKNKSASLGDHLNARFLVIDPNDEYGEAFQDVVPGSSVRRFAVKIDQDDSINQLRVPIWLWNSLEWTEVAQARPGVQQPALRRALRNVRSSTRAFDHNQLIGIYLSKTLTEIRTAQRSGPEYYAGYANKQNLGNFLFAAHAWLSNMTNTHNINLSVLAPLGQVLVNTGRDDRGNYIRFNPVDVENLIPMLEADLQGINPEDSSTSLSEDLPVPYSQERLVEELTNSATSKDLQQFIDYLTSRISIMLGDIRANSVIGTNDELTLEEWLTAYVGEDNGRNGEIAIIDLSLVPNDLVNIIAAVLGRLVFEAHQRYRRETGQVLPTVLVIEEAHNFLSPYLNSESSSSLALCTKVFEKIAKEGRKFGLGLVLSSQRPSELSPTVLSQCNTFILHRLVNERDQLAVRSLLPDNLGDILDELPVLPTQNAFVLGWAFPLPVLAEIRTLAREHQPHSSDPEYWRVWKGEMPRPLNWNQIVEAWYREGGYISPNDEGVPDS